MTKYVIFIMNFLCSVPKTSHKIIGFKGDWRVDDRTDTAPAIPKDDGYCHSSEKLFLFHAVV